MNFEWDEAKNQHNIEKHDLAFQMAPIVFESFHITRIDSRKDYGEIRFLTMGNLGIFERLVIIAHTRRDDKTRIISMRKANLREQKIYLDLKEKYDGKKEER